MVARAGQAGSSNSGTGQARPLRPLFPARPRPRAPGWKLAATRWVPDAQNWSRGFYEAYPEIQGLYYRSSLTNPPTVTLYERANCLGVFAANSLLHRALADPTLHNAVLNVGEEIGYGLI